MKLILILMIAIGLTACGSQSTDPIDIAQDVIDQHLNKVDKKFVVDKTSAFIVNAGERVRVCGVGVMTYGPSWQNRNETHPGNQKFVTILNPNGSFLNQWFPKDESGWDEYCTKGLTS